MSNFGRNRFDRLIHNFSVLSKAIFMSKSLVGSVFDNVEVCKNQRSLFVSSYEPVSQDSKSGSNSMSKVSVVDFELAVKESVW